MDAVPTERTEMRGIGVSPGRAVGPVVWMPDPIPEPPRGLVLPEQERAGAADRLNEAAAVVKAALEAVAARAIGDGKAILDATALMAADPTLLSSAREKVIADGVSPERAVWDAASEVAATLASLGGRMAARARDVRDVRDRLVAQLTGRPAPGVPQHPGPFVLIARDLAPADTATLDRNTVRGLVTAEGGPTSHTAIIACELGIPAIVAASDVVGLAEGTVVLIDGEKGVVRPNPSPEEVRQFPGTSGLRRLHGTGITKDGRPIALLANVGDPGTARTAADAGAEGVGLFRTEFCFLDRERPPTVAEQVAQYRRVFDAFSGKRVVVRTLDAGADKPVPFLTRAAEANPALGVRGLRTFWRAPEVLRDQLEAITTAAAQATADVWVMAPMVATVDEARDFVALCAEYGLTTAGVMIEIPSAAVCAADIFAHAKFGSIGTNDLTQYAMAADRTLAELSPLATAWQPGVLRLVKLACDGAARHDRPIGVCGEDAADPAMACVLVGLGATSLSMSPRAIFDVARALATVTYDDCAALAGRAVAADSANEARDAVRTRLPTLANVDQ